MGSQSKYKTRDLRYVPVKPVAGATVGDTVKYAFLSNIPDTYAPTLGHVLITSAMASAPIIGLVLGCSYPKPGRATKKINQRIVSSFFDQTKKLDLKKAGWKTAKTRALAQYRDGGNARSLVQTVFVTVNSINYAWNPPKVTIQNVTEATLAALGVRLIVPDIADLVFGADFPKPPRFSKTLVDGDDVKVVSSFYDPSVSVLPDGIDIAGNGQRILSATEYMPST